MEKIIISIMFGIVIFGLYVDYQLETYRLWVKADAISDFEACMLFERERKGEEHCKEYAKGPVFTPYPLWKSLIFIDPINCADCGKQLKILEIPRASLENKQ